MSARWVPIALAVALVGGTSLLAVGAGVLPTGEEDPGPPRVRVLIHNEGTAHLGRDATAGLELTRDDETVLESDLELAPGRTFERTVESPRDDHSLGLEVRNGRSTSAHSYSFETTACPGLYQVRIDLEVSAADSEVPTSTSYPRDANGCMATPPGYEELRSEAQRVIKDPPSGGSIDVPAPRVGGGGTYMYGPVEAAEGQADFAIRFRWDPFEGFPDAWGRPVDGYEARWTGVVLEEDDDFNATFTDRFRPRSSRAFATSGGTGGSSSSFEGTLHQMRQEVRSREIEYLDDDGTGRCLFRFALQGQAIQEGRRIPGEAVCAPGPDDLTLTVGEIVDRSGYRAAPLYALDEHDGRTFVARYWLAEGVPYIVGAELYLVAEDGSSHSGAYRLARHQAGEEPLPPTDGSRGGPASPSLVPIEPLEGPAAGEAQARFDYTLRQASRDAREDPTLGELQQLLADDDAVLAGAAYRIRRDVQDPRTGLESDRPTWYMVFTAPGAEPVHVLCGRPDPQTGDVAVPSTGSCDSASFAPDWAFELRSPPALGRADLPAEGAGFEMAVDRWEMVEPGGDAGAPSYALYRTWNPHDTERRGWIFDDPPVLSVGSAQTLPSEVLPSEESGTYARVEVNLTDARSRAVVYSEGWRSTSLLGTGSTAPEMDDAFVGSRIGTAGTELPVLAGTAATLGLVGLIVLALTKGKAVLASLYTRIKGEEVLDHEIRQAMADRVEEDPGIHAHALTEALDLAHGQARHHLRVLVREGILTEIASGGFKRYFRTGTYDVDQMRAMAALRNGRNDKAFRVIRDHPGIGVGDVAERAGISTSYASKAVSELADVGLVDKVRDGRRVALYADEDPDAA